MISLFRFSPAAFNEDISGDGARKFGGRWNSKGYPVVYTSTTISLALVELLIHAISADHIKSNHLLHIHLPEITAQEIKLSSLKKNWVQDFEYTQFIGDGFLREKSSLLLKIPSAVIPSENNLLINPLHPDFKKIKQVSSESFVFDTRLFK
ncbi:MAG: hypothetical protein JWN76_2897 [Chitinophagaceae bacterium]|nr:hypothetical protein [Chitinophagaceae bacterium]